jgi:biopolymer transport protein TolQ
MPFEHLLRDPVLIILALASLVSWALIIESLLALRRVCRDDRLALEGKHAPQAPIACLRQELHRNAGSDRPHLLTVMDTAIVLQRQRLEKGLPLLGVIGSTAPYVGLLGTVIGIIQAFQAIEAKNNMSPSIVAGGIATALVATAMGLAVAIPAVAAHHLISAAITRRVSLWESVVAEWLPQDSREAKHESIPVA